jgi:endogenous inhibitor of DNA gyrase (YacG/DUF329 family)
MAVDVVKIASIHFAPLIAKRNYRATSYRIQAVPLGAEPFILPIRGVMQFDEGPVINGPGGGRRQKLRYPVLPQEIANCLVGEWTGTTVSGLGMNPECHPGVWVVRDRLPVTEKTQKLIDGENITFEEKMLIDADGNQEFRDATDEERQDMWDEDLAAARKADRNYAEWCWAEGNRISEAWKRGGELVPRHMPPLYKLAATQYGLEADWIKEAVASNARNCPHCGTPGGRENWMCQKCGQPIDIDKWAQFQAQKEAAMRLYSKELQKSPLPPPIKTPPPVQASA